jgi:hypothetical protein
MLQLSNPEHSAHWWKKNNTAQRISHHDCHGVISCRQLSTLICLQLCQFASFKRLSDTVMSSTHIKMLSVPLSPATTLYLSHKYINSEDPTLRRCDSHKHILTDCLIKFLYSSFIPPVLTARTMLTLITTQLLNSLSYLWVSASSRLYIW